MSDPMQPRATDDGTPAASGTSNTKPARGAQPRSFEQVMERVVASDNWNAALKAVMANDGAPGPDGMRACELRDHLARHRDGIVRKLLEGRFQPAPARRTEIPKASGGTRGLSIPNVVDRFVQQLLLQALTPLLDPNMSATSYGFRPGRSAHQAVEQARQYAKAGYSWVVDLDIEQFFDRVNHDKLMHRLGQEVRDKRVLGLIGRMLRAGHIQPDGGVIASEEGTPQGGPLSPLLANLYLDTLDQELTRRGLRFCRYADDCNIYVRSEQAARRVLASLTQWLDKELKLTVHPHKSGVGRPWERKFLGFTITALLLIAISSASLLRYKDHVREHFTGRGGGTTQQLSARWQAYVRGWWGYYRLAEDRQALQWLDGWTRRHMRKCFWQRWHSRKGRLRHLRALGIDAERARVASSTRGAWRVARFSALQQALSNRRLAARGFLLPTQLG
jgi:group II intron reverse transcriptase/maturase